MSVCITLAITPSTAITSQALDMLYSFTTSGLHPAGNKTLLRAIAEVEVSIISATAGSDFMAASSETLIFPAGSTDGSMQCLSINVTEEGDDWEGDEYFNVVFRNRESLIDLPNSRTFITIIDSNGKIRKTVIIIYISNKLSNHNSVITVSVPATLAIAEDGGSVVVCATLSNLIGNTQNSIFVRLATADNTGTTFFLVVPTFIMINCSNTSSW